MVDFEERLKFEKRLKESRRQKLNIVLIMMIVGLSLNTILYVLDTFNPEMAKELRDFLICAGEMVGAISSTNKE